MPTLTLSSDYWNWAFRKAARKVIPFAWRRHLLRVGRQYLKTRLLSPAAIRELSAQIDRLPAPHCDIVYFLAPDGEQAPPLVSSLAEAGHRVFCVSPCLRPDGAAYEVQQQRQYLYTVSLRGPGYDGLFEALNALRRDLSLGATAAFVSSPVWWPLAKEARARFAWPVVGDCSENKVSLEDDQSADADQASADLALTPALLEGHAADRLATLTTQVRGAFPPVSIIIVTYNNLDLNRICLKSLYGYTEWPNFEVIVVDNASTDGTPEFLKQAAETYPNLRLILNDRNLGFAAANNQGLAEAGGQYLVLLNNDTVLPRAWLSALVRHLAADPQIGILGPSTNQIGNEAKVEIGYKRVKDMPAWAAEFTRQHDGQLFPIAVPAMFCVAMRREVFEQVGPLDERFGTGMFEDDDYARRLRELGYKVLCARDAFVHHAWGASFNRLAEDRYRALFDKNRRLYEEKWGEMWQPHVDEKVLALVPTLQHNLREIVSASGADAGRVVVFLSTGGWSNSLPQRSQHLATELARQGYLAFFDCSGDLAADFTGFAAVEKNLWLYKGPPGVLDILERPILWAQVHHARLVDGWKDRTVVYDCVADPSAFHYNQARLEDNHRQMLKEADLVLCVSQNQAEQLRSVRPDAVYLPNAVEPHRFLQPTGQAKLDPRFKRAVGSGRPAAAYFGAVGARLDVELLAEVARLRPDWSFVIIGPRLCDAPSLGRLEELPNVLTLGAQEYKNLPLYLAAVTATMVPFKVDRVTQSASPLKLYDSFAAGKPVVSTSLPECQVFPEVYVARNAQEFAQALDSAAEWRRKPEFQERLRELAREHSWTARVQTLAAHLSRLGEVRRNEDEEGLAGPALEVARRFRRFRTPHNRRFFKRLSEHLAGLSAHPCLPMYFEFAITCNERGQQVADLLRQYTELRGKRYLDVGCAYAGFLVAFARHGAEVTGVDISPGLLDLARHNLADNGLDAPVLVRNATRSEEVQDFWGSFDVVTCNDVIEHVTDPLALVRHIAGILRPGGVAYFEIPNGKSVPFVLKDGHYQLFGITLLDYPDAERYFSLHEPGRQYDVYSYFEIDRYRELFAQGGLRLTVLDETFQYLSLETILGQLAELKSSAEAGLETVPEAVRGLVAGRLRQYLKEVEAAPRASAEQQRDFLLRYGAGFWRVLAHKI